MSAQCPKSSSIVQNITGSALEYNELDSSSSPSIDRSRVSAQVNPPPIPRRSQWNKSDWSSRKLVTAAPHNIDQHEWVKYGEKKISGCKCRRCYYRCTYHKDGCGAKKQVQQQEHGDPPLYEVTYRGEHACKLTELSIRLGRQLTIRGCISEAQEQLRSYSNNTIFLNFDSSSCSASYPASHPTAGACSSPTEPLSQQNNCLAHDLAEEIIGMAEDDQQIKGVCASNKNASADHHANFLESHGLEAVEQPDFFSDYGVDDLFLLDDDFSWSYGIDDASFPAEN